MCAVDTVWYLEETITCTRKEFKMIEEKDKLLSKTSEEEIQETSGVEENITQTEAENVQKNKWMLWVMGIVLVGLIAFLIVYVIGKPAGTTTPSANSGNTNPNTDIASISTDPSEVMAIVGDIEITSGMVEQRAIKVIAQSQQMSPDQLDLSDPQVKQQVEQAKNFILSQVIQEVIFEESAKLEGFKVADEDLGSVAQKTIDEQIKPYVTGKPLSEWTDAEQAQWDGWLSSQGFGSEEDLVRDFILRYPDELKLDALKRLLYGEELDKITVSELEARNWFNAPGRIKVSHILFKFDPETDPAEKEDEARNNADQTRLTILSGSNFTQMASELSEDPSAESNKGDLGWYSIQNGKLVNEMGGQLVPEFEAAAMRLNIGEVSPVVKTQFGFHVITLTETESNSARYDIPEGIRIASIQFLNNAQIDGGAPAETETPTEPVNLEAEANEALSKIIKGEMTFSEAVAAYSDDMMTKENGGEIPSFMATDQSGFFWADLKLATQYDGQGMYPFDKIVVEKLWTTPEGEIYPEPIRVSKGWFIGKVIAHRKSEIAIFDDIKERVINDQLGAKKNEFEQNWMEAAREKIKVEYKTQPSMMGSPQMIGQP